MEEISESLNDEGYFTLCAKNAEELWQLTHSNTIKLFLLDLKLPDANGLDLARKIRKESNVGIIIVSGKTSELDRVVGLEVGADDYISKPFSPAELLARIRSVLRRTEDNFYPDKKLRAAGEEVIEFAGWQLDLGAHHLLTPDKISVELTAAEFELLKTFVETPNRVLSRDFLLDRVHGDNWAGYDRGIDGLVSRLRRKIKMPSGTAAIIKTVRGSGYMFTPCINVS